LLSGCSLLTRKPVPVKQITDAVIEGMLNIRSTDYFHVVFTLPHALNPIVLNNKKVMLTILFKAASKTLLAFGENTFGGKLVRGQVYF